MAGREGELWGPELRWALTALSSGAADQVACYGSGARVTCELVEDFLTGADGYLYEHESDLESLHVRALEAVREGIQRLDPDSDLECFEVEPLYSSVAWQEVRAMAANALSALGWQPAPLSKERRFRSGEVKRDLRRR